MPSHICTFRICAIAITATTIVAAALQFPAAAEQAAGSPFTAKQCEDAVSISTAIMTKYKGKISGKLAESFGRFRESKCDLKTPFTRVEGTADEQAFGEFRVRLVALRS